MEKILKLYNYVDGVNDTPFPNKDDQVIIGDFRSDYKRMGAAPTISCTVHHRLCLDDLWSYNVYASFNGEKFFIKQIPSSSFDNTDARYKHDLELVSERIILDNVYFYDVVSEDYEEDKPVSNSSNVVFFGDIHEFAQRLNHSLNYSKLNYSVVVDEGISSEAKLLSFQDQFFSNVLQEIYNVYEIPYYIVGNVIHIGYTDNTISHVFKYGVDESLLSIQKQNANKKIVNRITGIGSSDNVPYYYPNFDNKGVTEVLYNGETGKVNIVDENKYNKIKLNDVLSYNMYKVDDKSLLDNSFFTDINFTYTDYESQYGIEFYYKFTIKETCNIRLSLKTTYQDSEDIFCDLYDENKNYIGYFKDGDVATNLSAGNYRIKVTWNLVYAEPMTRPLAEQLVIEHISVNAIIVGETTYWWSLNGKTIKLSDYGISLSIAPSVGDEISVRQLSYIKPSAHLMPSIYRETIAKERFYNAINNAYTKPNSDEYYSFNNPYIVGKPKEYIYNLEDIKPTIKGITNEEDLRIDMFSEFAFDENDNDEFDAEGNRLHPYFFGKLRKFDGEFGFNLFDHAIDEAEMVISMTSGSCGACEFIIGVDDETQKNLVQVDENGNLLRDSNGNVRCGRVGMPKETPQEKQNDTKNNEVWVALKKDHDTFGVLMPNAQSNYRPQVGDTFVILHIDLPKAYILTAEKKLEQELIKYMSENNDEKFTFSLSFSRIFFAENPTILEQLDENSRIQIEYDGRQYLLYVSSYSYNITNEQPLPEIRIELSDVLTIAQNSLNNTISELKTDFLSNINLTESQILLYTSNVKKDLNSKVDNTKEEIHQTISNVETAMQQYTNDAKAVLHESIKSINEIKVNTKDVYTKQDIDDNFVTKKTTQEISGEKNFIGGFKINNQEIIYDVEKKYWKFQGNLVITGGIVMYAQDGNISVPTIAEGLPFDGKTIWFNNATQQIEVIGGTGGGSGEGGVNSFWELNGIPTWITIGKPVYSYSEINNTPDLSVYALKSAIPSLNGYATEQWVKNQGYLTQHQDLSGYQPLITSTNQLAYSLISGVPTSLKNPNALSFGSKSYDGSAKITLTASDLGALTNHQTIYTLTFQSGTFASGSFTANSANKTINIPTTTSHISEGSNLYFTNARAVSALTDTLKAYVTLSGTQTITGEKNFTGGLKVNGSPLVYNKESGYWKLEGDLLVTGGVSMFASDSEFTPSTIMDAIAVDNVTIIKQDGKLVALGGGGTGGGGVADAIAWGNVLGKPAWITDSAPSINVSGVNVSLGGSITQSALRTALGLGSNAYSSTAYLPLSGGTLSNSAYNILTIKRNTTNDNYGIGLQFANDNGTACWLSANTKNKYFQRALDDVNYIIWDSGNDGSGSGLDADLLDGQHANDLSVHKSRLLQSYNDTTLDNTGLKCYYGTINKGETTDGTWCSPDGSYDGVDYGSVVRMVHSSTYYTDIFLNANASNIKYRQVIKSSSKGWKTIATLTDNVASATKLQTARTIWGQSFDGTANIDGGMTFANNAYVIWKTADGASKLGILNVNGSNNLYVGYDMSTKGYNTYIDGNNIYLRYGTSHTTGIELTSTGRISAKGNIDLPNNKAIYFKDSTGTDIQMLYAQNNNDFILGGGTCSKKYWTLIKGYKIALYTAESGTRAMLINDSGNITIGSSDSASTTYKLYVKGTSYFSSQANFVGNLYKYNAAKTYRLSFVSDSDYCSIYNIKADGSAYGNLVLQGNVGIGTTSPSTKLHVAGDILSTAFLRININNSTYDRLRLVASSNGYSYIQASNADGTSTQGGSLYVTGINTTNLASFEVMAITSKFHGNILATGGVTTNDSMTINGIKLYKSQDGVLYLDGNLVVRGGVTMYGSDSESAPSILDSLPIASTSAKGIAQFSSAHFTVTDGIVSIIGSNIGLNKTELESYLTTNKFVNSVAVTGNGNAITSASISGKTLTLTKGTSYLPLTGGTLTNMLTIAPSTYTKTIKIANTDYTQASAILFMGNSGDFVIRSTYASDNSISDLRFNKNSLKVNGKTVYHSGNFTPSDYLPLTGGALTGNLSLQYANPRIILKDAEGTTLGSFGLNNDVLSYYKTADTKWYTIYHSGNFTPSNYLPLSGGTLSGQLTLDHDYGSNSNIIFKNNRLSSTQTSNTADNVILINDATNTTVGRLGVYGILGVISYMYMGLNGYNGNNLRIYNDKVTFGNSQLAYLTSNVASATKLATSRTIWGQSFDGTGNIDGKLIINNNTDICGKATDGTAMSVLQITASNNLSIGLDVAAKGYNTYISGNNIYLRYGTSRTTGLTLNSSGKLIIAKDVHMSNNMGIGFKDTNGTNRFSVVMGSDNILRIGSGNAVAGYNTYLLGNNVHIRYGTSQNLGLILNSSGNITIGSSDLADSDYKLYVGGKTYINDALYTNNSIIKINSGNDYRLVITHNGGEARIYNYLSDDSGYGNLRIGTKNSNCLFFDGVNSRIGIKTTTPDYTLDVNGVINTNNNIYAQTTSNTARQIKVSNDVASMSLYVSAKGTKGLYDTANSKWFVYTDGTNTFLPIGNVLATGGITMYSARKLKNITDEKGLSLEELSVIKPTRFTWKDNRDNKIHIGGIADDVMKVLPEVIYKTDDDTLTMDYGNAAFAIAASLIKPVVSHEQRIKVLEEENERLKREIEQLKWNIA